ncbi:Late embryogenesis abundant protein, LEA_1 subgroup [Dillenia turbinata]|uniref:Late embryogenesis abundant protein, LEA_1 subgroup n=1 Tax=Dillenia turbinata TaxID=194707 RepID=A0AAN8W5V3_9MAGN
MQAGKDMMESVKETVANIGASARSGMDKTKAAAQEKIDLMTANSPREREMATERKNARMTEAELRKQEAYGQNAAARQAALNPGGLASYRTGSGTESNTHNTHTNIGSAGQPMETHVMSPDTMPGYGTGVAAGRLGEETMGHINKRM